MFVGERKSSLIQLIIAEARDFVNSYWQFHGFFAFMRLMMIVYRTRTCTKCGEVLILTSDNFHFAKEKDGCGMDTKCKKCKSQCAKKSYKNNKDHILAVNKKWRNSNPEFMKNYSKKLRNENPQKVQEQKQKWLDKNPQYMAKYNRKRKSKDPLYKLTHQLREIVSRGMNKKQFGKSTQEILGCTFEEYKIYIENLWTKGMNWNNHGPMQEGYWQIHHILPLHTAEDVEELVALNHYTNHIPLWTENHLKTHKHLSRCGL